MQRSFGIKELPKSIGKLRNLGYLNLARNQLKSLPEEIENLRNLGYLSLAHNQLKSLPGSIEGLVSLMHLDLTNNPLTDIRSRLYIGQDLVILQENLALPPKPSTTKAQASGCQAEGEHDRGQ
jgi:Leucine-rich repeat (LRR) protein